MSSHSFNRNRNDSSSGVTWRVSLSIQLMWRYSLSNLHCRRYIIFLTGEMPAIQSKVNLLFALQPYREISP